MLRIRPQETLDGGNHGWLNARHHFAVSAQGNPANGRLGALIVWNDDQIAPGTGFGRHTHADIEIITYVRQGVVTHEDSAGNVGTTVAGDVQVMSTGTGISHSEQTVATSRSSCSRFGCFLSSAAKHRGGRVAAFPRAIMRGNW
jgi:redox-sensitive bicupin YhaK (pirin superfamily)